MRVTAERARDLPSVVILSLWEDERRPLSQKDGFLDLMRETESQVFHLLSSELRAWAQRYEFFMIKSPPIHPGEWQWRQFRLAIVPADPPEAETDFSAFGEHFIGHPPDAQVIAFNSRDPGTRLVVPCPLEWADCRDLARLLRQPATWRLEAKLFAHAAREVVEHVSSRQLCVWFNTHGYGVPWIHLRIDQTPKYYESAYPPFAVAERTTIISFIGKQLRRRVHA